jgi:hypothetical protein
MCKSGSSGLRKEFGELLCVDARADELLAECATMPSQLTFTDQIGIQRLMDKRCQLSK